MVHITQELTAEVFKATAKNRVDYDINELQIQGTFSVIHFISNGIHGIMQTVRKLIYYSSNHILLRIFSFLSIIPVLTKPRFLQLPLPTEVTEGKAFTLTAAAGGNPVPTLTWWKNDQQLSAYGGWRVEEKRDHLMVSSTLSVESACESAHGGRMVVKAENEAGCADQDVDVNGKSLLF